MYDLQYDYCKKMSFVIITINVWGMKNSSIFEVF